MDLVPVFNRVSVLVEKPECRACPFFIEGIFVGECTTRLNLPAVLNEEAFYLLIVSGIFICNLRGSAERSVTERLVASYEFY